MYVVAQHRFTDPESAWHRVQDALRQQPPANVKLHHSLATKDGTRAACLWEAPFAPALKHMLDQTFAGVGENECYEVENAEGIGLPSNLLPQVGAAGNAERNIALVKSAYAAFLRGDIEGAIADLDQDVDWQPVLGVADFVPIAGKYKGRAETRGVVRLWGSISTSTVLSPRNSSVVATVSSRLAAMWADRNRAQRVLPVSG